MTAIATVTGTALLPGVSRNKRVYSVDAITRAVERAQERLASPDGMPLTMMVAHPEPDKAAYLPVTKIVGRVTEMWQESDGRARFRAEVHDTRDGGDVLKLVDRSNGQPVLKGVSIRGNWLGRTRRVVLPGGEMGETADDLELDGIDYTHRPGVPGAEIEQVEPTGDGPRESGPDGRTPIFESVQEALVETIEEAAAPGAPAAKDQPYGDVVYADPGYQKDKKKRYPLDTKRRAKSAWSYINQEDNAKLYTAAQLKRVRGRIIKALKKFGVDVDVKEGWLIDRIGTVTESSTVAEHYDFDAAPGYFSINLCSGPLNVSISSSCIDPHDIEAIGRAAMAAAAMALAAIDPDLDGDIDVPGADAEDTDGDSTESAPQEAAAAEVTAVDLEAAPADEIQTPPAVAGGSPTTEEATVVSDETTNPAVETAAPAAPAVVPTITLTTDQFQQLLAAATRPAAAPVEAAPAAPAPVAEAAPAAPVTETDDQRIARLVSEQVAEQMAQFTRNVQESVAHQGPPVRKGLVGRVTESGELDTAGQGGGGLNSNGLPSHWPDKPLHEYTADERSKYVSAAMVEHVIGNRI